MEATNIVQFPRRTSQASPTIATAIPVRQDAASVIQFSEGEMRRQARAQLCAHNEALRAERTLAWEAADVERRFFEVLNKLTFAVEMAQKWGVPEAVVRYPKMTPEDHRRAYERYIEALLRQVLTPAPTVAAIAWKERILYGLKPTFRDRDAKRGLRMIVDDKAFLKAHPARQCRSNASRRRPTEA
ncbi:hypothetical protein [Bradyrhizobium sp.]|uniref:hypothetical protein n=1 Tax=Bradyrhizobium sp. TaxID=376 RepID=UPI0039E3688B